MNIPASLMHFHITDLLDADKAARQACPRLSQRRGRNATRACRMRRGKGCVRAVAIEQLR
jgi:hypothetical protein